MAQLLAFLRVQYVCAPSLPTGLETEAGALAALVASRELRAADAELEPPFEPGLGAYDAAVPAAATHITVAATPLDAGSEVVIQGEPRAFAALPLPAAGEALALRVGLRRRGAVQPRATAPAGAETPAYVVNVARGGAEGAGGRAAAPPQQADGGGAHGHGHAHGDAHGHSHDALESPGLFAARAPPLRRDFSRRSFTVGLGGPVGTGKTATMLALSRRFREEYSIGAVTNDIFTREDAEFLMRNEALPRERIRAVETGGCPHAAIREDISVNLAPLEELTQRFRTDFLLIESGGDNLAANYSRELADYIIYIIDVSGGDKIPRKGGPGITQADLLVINKTDLAPAVGADLEVMRRDAARMRDGGPVVFAQVKHGVGVDAIAAHILRAYEARRQGDESS